MDWNDDWANGDLVDEDEDVLIAMGSDVPNPEERQRDASGLASPAAAASSAAADRRASGRASTPRSGGRSPTRTPEQPSETGAGVPRGAR